MTTNGGTPAGGGAAFWAALGVRIEPEPEAEADEVGSEDERGPDGEPEATGESGESEETAGSAETIVIPAQVSQASLEEVEPQEGEVVDGLAVLSESLA